MSMSVENYLIDNGHQIMEGGCFDEQRVFFRNLLSSTPHIQNMLEIGFNAGSAIDTVLSVREDIQAVSFDIMHWEYVPWAKQYIDKKYPGRHVLISGDSTETIPKYETKTRFDLIFIDGGHGHPVPELDLLNCRRLAHLDTLVVMDDYCEAHGQFVMAAWDKAVREKMVIQIGEPKIFGNSERGWVIGKYALK